MASYASTPLFGLLLVTAMLGAFVGGSLVRLVLFKRMQRDYDHWRLGMRKEIDALTRARQEHRTLQTLLRRQAQHIAGLETQLSRLEVDRSRRSRTAPVSSPVRPLAKGASGDAEADGQASAMEPDDDEEDDVPVLTRRVDLGTRIYRGQKVPDNR